MVLSGLSSTGHPVLLDKVMSWKCPGEKELSVNTGSFTELIWTKKERACKNKELNLYYNTQDVVAFWGNDN